MAAANALLLQEKVKLPPSAVRNNVASLSDLTNVLANYVLQTSSAAAEESQFYFDELLRQIPKLQYGMDVNPKFTAGIMGYEYTQELTCFDLWHVKLVHGWILDPASEGNGAIFDAIGNKTYNELIELVIVGREADSKQSDTRKRLDELREQQQSTTTTAADGSEKEEKQQQQDVHSSDLLAQIAELEQQCEKLQMDATRASCIDHFLETTGHQLTQYGLSTLHQELNEDELTVFFRNNHFATLTKHDGSLFLLVTDLGYANTPMVVWEKLDVIDGDTEYVNSQFKAPGQISQSGSSLTPEQLMAQSSQNDADYHLALQLSGQPSDANINPTSQSLLDTEEGKLMAAATEASLREYHGQQQVIEPSSVQGDQQQPNQVAAVKHSPLLGSASVDQLAVGVPVPESQVPPSAATGQQAFGVEHATPFSVDAQRPVTTQEAADALLAQQLAKELMQEQQNQAQGSHEDDFRLAQRLQDEEHQRVASGQGSSSAVANTPTSSSGHTRNQVSTSSPNNKCIIS